MEEIFENITPISQNIYKQLNVKDIANIQSTSKNLYSYLKSYTKRNNSNFIRNQVYNIYIKTLYFLIYLTVNRYDYSGFSILDEEDIDFKFRPLQSTFFTQSYDNGLAIVIEINNRSKHTMYINDILNYLKKLNINISSLGHRPRKTRGGAEPREIDEDEEYEDYEVITCAFSYDINEFYYFMFNFPIHTSKLNLGYTNKYKFRYKLIKSFISDERRGQSPDNSTYSDTDDDTDDEDVNEDDNKSNNPDNEDIDDNKSNTSDNEDIDDINSDNEDIDDIKSNNEDDNKIINDNDVTINKRHSKYKQEDIDLLYNYYLHIDNLFIPNKNDLIKLLKILQNIQNSDDYIFKYLNMIFFDFFNNTGNDFLKFIYNNL